MFYRTLPLLCEIHSDIFYALPFLFPLPLSLSPYLSLILFFPHPSLNDSHDTINDFALLFEKCQGRCRILTDSSRKEGERSKVWKRNLLTKFSFFLPQAIILFIHLLPILAQIVSTFCRKEFTDLAVNISKQEKCQQNILINNESLLLNRLAFLLSCMWHIHFSSGVFIS